MKEKVHKQFTITNINHKLFEEDVNKYLTVGWDILDGSYSKESKNGDTIYSQILVWRDAADSEIEFENNYPIKKTESIKGNKVRITKWFGNLSMGEGGKISLIKEGFNNEKYAKEGMWSEDFNGNFFQKDGEYICYYDNGNINYNLYYKAGKLKGKGAYYYRDGQLWLEGKFKNKFSFTDRCEPKGLFTIYSYVEDEFFIGKYGVNYSGPGAGNYDVFSQLIADHLRDGYGPKIIFFDEWVRESDLSSSLWRRPIFYCEVLNSIETSDVTTAEIKLVFFHKQNETKEYHNKELYKRDFEWWNSFSYSTFKIEYGESWQKLVPVSISICSNGLKFLDYRDIYLFRDRLNVSGFQNYLDQRNEPLNMADHFDGNVIIYDQAGEPLIKFNNPLYFKELRRKTADHELNPIETGWEWENNDKMYKRAELSFYYMEEDEKALHKWEYEVHNKHKDSCEVNYTLKCYNVRDELIFEGKGCQNTSKGKGKDCGWEIIVNSMTNSPSIMDFSLSNFMPIKVLFENIGILDFNWSIFKAMRKAWEIYYKQDQFYELIDKSKL